MRTGAFVIGVAAVFAAAFLACSDTESENDVTMDDAGTVDGASDASSLDAAPPTGDADAAPSRIVFGNPSITTEGNPDGQPFSTGYLLGHAIVTTSSFTLTMLAVNAIDPGPSVVLALYADSAGAPSALVASTATETLVSGPNELPVAPVVLPAGTYWMAATYSADAKIANGNDNATVIAFTAHTFGTPLPDPFSATKQTSDQTGFYLVGTP